jgi:hypothetical protein
MCFSLDQGLNQKGDTSEKPYFEIAVETELDYRLSLMDAVSVFAVAWNSVRKLLLTVLRRLSSVMLLCQIDK